MSPNHGAKIREYFGSEVIKKGSIVYKKRNYMILYLKMHVLW